MGGLIWAMAVSGAVVFGCLYVPGGMSAQSSDASPVIGREMAVPRHLHDGEEFRLSLVELVDSGRKLFTANWTDQDGGGRPLSKGSGKALSDAAHPLKGSAAFNRVSGPDANSCQGCHNRPDGVAGGAGDFVASAFELAQRFDFVTFDRRRASHGRSGRRREARRVARDGRERPIVAEPVRRRLPRDACAADHRRPARDS